MAIFDSALLLKGIVDVADDFTGLLGDFDFGIDVFVFGVDEEIEAFKLLRQTFDFDDDGFELVALIHVVDSDLLEIGSNDPTGLTGIGKLVGVAFRLLERSKEFAVGLFGGLIEIDAAGLLFYERLG